MKNLEKLDKAITKFNKIIFAIVGGLIVIYFILDLILKVMGK